MFNRRLRGLSSARDLDAQEIDSRRARARACGTLWRMVLHFADPQRPGRIQKRIRECSTRRVDL
jgi:hypothetical protein